MSAPTPSRQRLYPRDSDPSKGSGKPGSNHGLPRPRPNRYINSFMLIVPMTCTSVAEETLIYYYAFAYHPSCLLMMIQTRQTVRRDQISEDAWSSFSIWDIYSLQHVLVLSPSPSPGWGSPSFYELNQSQFDETWPYIPPLGWPLCFTADVSGAFGPTQGCDAVAWFQWSAVTRFRRQQGCCHLRGLTPDGAIYNRVISSGMKPADEERTLS